MSVLTGGHSATDLARERKFGSLYSRNAKAVVGRGLMAARSSTWLVMVSGVLRACAVPAGHGRGHGLHSGHCPRSRRRGNQLCGVHSAGTPAVSAMNGAIYDSTWNVFFKMNFAKLYQGMLYTSLGGPLDVAIGEIFLALLRGLLYATGFTAVMGGDGTAHQLVGRPGHSCFGADRVRFCELRDGHHQLHEDLPADGLDQLFPAAHVPVQRHVLPLSVYPQVIQWFIQAMPPVARGGGTPAPDQRGLVQPCHCHPRGYYVVMIALGSC